MPSASARRSHPARSLRSLLRRPGVVRDLRRLDRLEHFGDARVVFGNEVEVLCGGRAAYDSMLEAIAGARESIAIEMYTWSDDAVGRRFADAVRERWRQGVAVFVVVDAFGSLGSGGLLEGLRRDGVPLFWYNPLAPRLSRWIPNRRNHRKLIVVDGEVAFTGGINLSECHSEEFLAERAWCDLAVRIAGPAVRELARLFVGSWARAGGTIADAAIALRHPAERGAAGVQVLGHLGRRGRRALRRTYVGNLELARQSIVLAYAYFVPEVGLRRAIARAARRGVSVQLLLPGVSDVPFVRWAGRALYGGLLEAGVEIRELRSAVLHAKVGVFDGEVLAMGSVNLDARSFRHNLEVSVNVFDAAPARAALGMLEDRFRHSEKITLAGWTARPRLDRVLEGFASMWRYWL